MKRHQGRRLLIATPPRRGRAPGWLTFYLLFVLIWASFFTRPTAAIAEVQNTGTGGGSATSVAATFSSNTTNGNLIIVAYAGAKAGGPANPSIAGTIGGAGDGNTYTQVGAGMVTNGNFGCALWYAKNISGGATHKITATVGAAQTASIGIIEYSGCDTSAPFDNTANSTGSSASPSSGNVTVSGSNEMVVGVCTDSGATTSITAGSGFVGRFINTTTGTAALGTEDKIGVSVNTAATFTLGGTLTWSCIGASFKPAAAASSSVQIATHRGGTKLGRLPNDKRLLSGKTKRQPTPSTGLTARPIAPKHRKGIPPKPESPQTKQGKARRAKTPGLGQTANPIIPKHRKTRPPHSRPEAIRGLAKRTKRPGPAVVVTKPIIPRHHILKGGARPLPQQLRGKAKRQRLYYFTPTGIVVPWHLFQGGDMQAIKGQPLTVTYLAWNTKTNRGQTADALNHTLRIVQDGNPVAPTNLPTEVDTGLYEILLTGGDMSFNFGSLAGGSTTSNVVIIPVPIVTNAVKGSPLTTTYFAWNTSQNSGQTGDALNHTVELIQDGAKRPASTAPVEVDPVFCSGLYKLPLLSNDTAYNAVTVNGKSSTGNVVIFPVEVAFAPTASVALAGTPSISTYPPFPRGLDLSQDYLTWDNTEVVHLSRTSVHGQGMNYSIPIAKWRNLTKKELATSGGAYTGLDRALLIPTALLPSDYRPKPGDLATDQYGTVHTVLEAGGNKRDQAGEYQTWRLVCRDPIIVFDLQDTIDIERATILTDAAGNKNKVWPEQGGGSLLYSAIAAKVQLIEDTVIDERGIRGFEGKYNVLLSQQVPNVRYEDRIKWKQATPALGQPGKITWLVVAAVRNPQRIDELPYIEAVGPP